MPIAENAIYVLIGGGRESYLIPFYLRWTFYSIKKKKKNWCGMVAVFHAENWLPGTSA